MKYLFEVSWEVCNKVGGIHTVIATKVEEAQNEFGKGYITLGPDLGQTEEFIEVDFSSPEEEFLKNINSILAGSNIQARVGRWDIAGKPPVILVKGFHERFNADRLLYTLWEHFGVDSYEGKWDYIEPILFSTACAEIIELIVDNKLNKQADHALAHFHEWMCGAGILYLEKNAPEVGTIFTTHATVLGRATAATNPFYYHEMELSQDRLHKAHTHGVKSKHSLESISANIADCFTTVSEFTSRESHLVLGKKADFVVYNGLNFEDIPKFESNRVQGNRKKVLETCSEFLGEKLPDNTQIWLSSGRYEFRNKGYDITLEALAELRKRKGDNLAPVLMLFTIAADRREADKSEWLHREDKPAEGRNPIAINNVYEPQHDAVLNTTKHFNLDEKESPVKVVCSTLYFDGQDGIFNIPYEDILECADLTLFPSFYEPWGYTPLESVARGVPTITSDLSGFGHWAMALEQDWSDLIKIAPRRNKTHEEGVLALTDEMERISDKGILNKEELFKRAVGLKEIIDWDAIYPGYKSAYDIALAKGYDRYISAKNEYGCNPFENASCSLPTVNPRLYCLELQSDLPEQIAGLNKMAYNLWWTWNDAAKELFKSINPQLWEFFNHNPVKLLRSMTYSQLKELQIDNEFMIKYQAVYKEYQEYVGDAFAHDFIDNDKPVISYFSMEYGSHECLPIYSGGLGILSGDHMKAASDLDLNMVGIGLFYNNGYYIQEINGEGRQIEHYPYLDWKSLPVKVLLNQFGEQVKIPVKFPGRTVWTRVVVVHCGRIPMFLFDTDIEENSPEDRAITAKLYVGDRKARIEQEMLVGIAGIRLLKDVLNVNPSVYHLNEGHCAFMAVEQIRRLTQQGYSFETAVEAIKKETIFTTHTPVPAGNEAFDVNLVRDTFTDFFNTMDIPTEKFLDLGISDDNHQEFSMTALALRVSSQANGVSKLHGEVSCKMWQHIVGKENYIGAVTNGVHLNTWMGPEIKSLFMNQEIAELPNSIVWQKHQVQKQRLIDELKIKINDEYTRKGIEVDTIREIVSKLNQDIFLVGFARRFASYKRANLLLSDKDKLREILNNQEKPATIIFAGKAHPADGMGKDLIQNLYHTMLEPEFRGRIIILENYNIYWGGLLTQGVDLWLNTPIINKEACGTSGMKAAMNGVLNFSIPDGWWAEARRDGAGFTIPPHDVENIDEMNEVESKAIYKMLESEIIPKYYDRGSSSVPNEWVDMMKQSIARFAIDFAAKRMLEDYNNNMYLTTIEKKKLITQ